MQFDDDILACAHRVQRGDTVRFCSVMAAPLYVRPALFSIYAFNLEASRAPWVSREPAIAEIRLQWWYDALDEISNNKSSRRHEVVSPLAKILSPNSARKLMRLVKARRWDIYSEPFENTAALERYLNDTSSTLLAVAAHSLGDAETTVVTNFGYAMGLARFLQAVPKLIAAGRHPLTGFCSADLNELVEEGLVRLRKARYNRLAVSKEAGFAFLAGWQTENILKRAQKFPETVKSGLRTRSSMLNSITLSARALTGRW